jgi:hypothetical protein
MFFFAGTNGFYDPNVNGDSIPEGAVKITCEQHQALLHGQSQGQMVSSDINGFPFLIDPLPPTVEQLAASERAWRSTELTTTDRMVARHRDELEEGASTTLTAEQYFELQAYRRALREWPSSQHFPDAEHRPARPDWLDQPTP